MSELNDDDTAGPEIDADALAALLEEYRAAIVRVGESVDEVAQRRSDDLACAHGCSSCCVEGLTVLEVEAAALSLHLQSTGLAADPAPPPGGCNFLDATGACTVYEARPLVCRTHGLPLRIRGAGAAERGSLHVIDDVAVCSLNFTEKKWAPDDVLDAERIQALLSVVNARFCGALGLDPDERVPLASFFED